MLRTSYSDLAIGRTATPADPDREGQQVGHAGCGLTAASHMRCDSPHRLPAIARRTLVAVAILCSLAKPASGATGAPGAFHFPLTRRDGVARARGLLRNASLPLHGAVRDYGCAFAPLTGPTPHFGLSCWCKRAQSAAVAAPSSVLGVVHIYID